MKDMKLNQPQAAALPSVTGEEDPGAALDTIAAGPAPEQPAGGGDVYRRAVLASDAAHRHDEASMPAAPTMPKP